VRLLGGPTGPHHPCPGGNYEGSRHSGFDRVVPLDNFM
ncbi:MAG: hypothetical protein, partial [Olavius algarvensis Gamma 1 endosymbiont]